MSWSITEEKRGEKNIFANSFYPAGDSQKEKRAFLKGIRLVSAFSESRDLVLTPSRSDLVVQSSRFFGRNPRREIYNLGMVSGPVL